MAVRSAWYNTLCRIRLPTVRSAAELVSAMHSTPIDLTELGTLLGARIETLPDSSARSGGLSREGDDWVIWIDGTPSCLDPDDRFAVAHELAHLLFMGNGLGIPIGEEEYWMLESACDQVAIEMLIPLRQAPSDTLAADDIAYWHESLIDTWNVASWIVADRICKCVSNVYASAIVRFEESRWGYVEWSVGQETVLDWPTAASTIDDIAPSCLHNILTTTTERGRVQSLKMRGGTLVGVKTDDEIVLYFLSQTMDQQSLFLFLVE